MPSAVLVERPNEQAEEPENGLAIRIVSVESRIDSVSLARAGDDPRRPGEAFGFDVSMTETGRTKDGLSVKYWFAFGRATGQNCRVSGRAAFRFSRLGVHSDLHALGSEIDNDMAVAIFKENYESIYLLHQALGLEAPSPWITQEVSLSARAWSP